MNTKVFKIIAIVILAEGCFYSCENKEAFSNKNGKATGTIIGWYSDRATRSLLIQVDRKYPIGKTIKYNVGMICLELPKAGTYQNIIQVQQSLPLSDLPESGLINKRISFSYREKGLEQEDFLLFTDPNVITHALCATPDVPWIVITNCQILK